MIHVASEILVSIGSENRLLSPVWHRAIFWSNLALLSIGHLGTNFSGILIKIQTTCLKKPKTFENAACKITVHALMCLAETLPSFFIHTHFPHLADVILYDRRGRVVCGPEQASLSASSSSMSGQSQPYTGLFCLNTRQLHNPRDLLPAEDNTKLMA